MKCTSPTSTLLLLSLSLARAPTAEITLASICCEPRANKISAIRVDTETQRSVEQPFAAATALPQKHRSRTRNLRSLLATHGLVVVLLKRVTSQLCCRSAA
jgi:hypothetical protein